MQWTRQCSRFERKKKTQRITSWRNWQVLWRHGSQVPRGACCRGPITALFPPDKLQCPSSPQSHSAVRCFFFFLHEHIGSSSSCRRPPKMKRTISDCSMGWGYLDEGPQKNITHRLACGVVSMRGGINEDAELPFDLPSLLHSDPDSWPLDSNKKVKVV